MLHIHKQTKNSVCSVFETQSGSTSNTPTQDGKGTLTLKIAKESEKFQTYKRGDTGMVYFNVVEETVVVRIYMRNQFSFLKPGMTYKITNLIKKGDSYWAVSSSGIGFTAPLKDVCADVCEPPEDQSPTLQTWVCVRF